MDYSAASPMGNPTQLGTPTPGTTGSLPMQGDTMGGGLPALNNPMVQQVQSQGRGNDSMLVHMTPDEVNSLQGLAMAHGGSLTINPETGLPEAGFLGKLLPMILGAALAATGVGAPLAAGIVGAGQFARTGSLKKGLMAGLGAFGGAGMAGMAGLGGSISHNALGILGDKPGMFGANMGLGAAAKALPVAVTPDTLGNLANTPVSQMTGPVNIPASGIPGGPGATSVTFGGPTAAASASPIQTAINSPEFARQFANSVGNMPAPIMKGAQFTGGLGSRFGQAVRAGLPSGTPGIISKAAPMLGVSGITSGVSGALSSRPSGSMGDDGVIDNSYGGPYTAQQRKASFADNTGDILSSSKERRYFDVDMPEIYNMQGQVVQPGSSTARGTPIMQNVLNPNAKKGQNRYNQILTPYMVDPQQDMGYADGGEVDMKNGSFVVDARTVSELGNGSSNAGMELLSRMGGRPLQGPGDGVSDSIRARIGGKQEARVARDEVLFPPEAVKRLGNGNPKKGTAKLYSLMNKAHKARKQARRGQDTKVRRGLA